MSKQNTLAEWLIDNKKTQVWLASVVGVTQGAVRKWTCGGGMRRQQAVKINKLTGIPIENLAYGDASDRKHQR